MKSLLTLASLLALLCLTEAAAWAQDKAPAQAKSAPAASKAPVVASAAAVEGTVFVTRVGARQALLARGSDLHLGDAIHTSHNSSVRLKFSDGGETVVRPDSTLAVQDYQYNQQTPGSDNLLLNLLKGGMRAITGAIGKRGNQDAYKLRVNTATVGIRGTDYSVRLCQGDCAEALDAKQRNSATPVAARAVQVRGESKVSHNGAALVALVEGQPLYSGDAVQTLLDSHVVLVFSDATRITVNPNSEIRVAEYLHEVQPGGGSVGSMVIDMLRGGLRFATGLIGKAMPAKVKVRSATATIGIRGTVFEVVCAPSPSASHDGLTELADMPCSQSMVAQTREGEITLSGDQGAPLVLAAGQTGRVNGANLPAHPLTVAPVYFRELKTPAPERVPVHLEQLFGSNQTPDSNDGIVLTVHAGKVVLAQAKKDILLEAGESAFAGRALAPVRLMVAPPVLNRDPFLSSGMFKPNMCRR